MRRIAGPGSVTETFQPLTDPELEIAALGNPCYDVDRSLASTSSPRPAMPMC
ncbi:MULTISPECIES: hypothetical protein [Methylococcus]|uniref:Uncharacterized protein n=1 Tax=Methylococcus capsulatus TaxID=414 RepID=A0ABZ2F1I9_METCP|nr:MULTISPECIES: hypothetical protein [Methylococcus]